MCWFAEVSMSVKKPNPDELRRNVPHQVQHEAKYAQLPRETQVHVYAYAKHMMGQTGWPDTISAVISRIIQHPHNMKAADSYFERIENNFLQSVEQEIISLEGKRPPSLACSAELEGKLFPPIDKENTRLP